MQRATPVQMRKSLEVVETFKKAGLWFVPMPVADETDFNNRIAEMLEALADMERMTSMIETMKAKRPSNAK